jgi:NAD(P)-dependent dehydrogenase (short-subunit alcohol dehydrogenase family)
MSISVFESLIHIERLAAPHVVFLNMDITKPSNIQAAVASIRSKYGHPSVLATSVGRGSSGDILSKTEPQIRKIFNIQHHLALLYRSGDFACNDRAKPGVYCCYSQRSANLYPSDIFGGLLLHEGQCIGLSRGPD